MSFPARTHLIALTAVLLTRFADAATLTVTNLNDSGAGSLRDTIAIAATGDTIVFAVTGTITLFSSLQINKNLTITGPGPASLTIQRDTAPDAFLFRIFYFDNGIWALSGVTISNGHDTSYGGGIYNQNGNLTVSNCVITGNQADNQGGGVTNSATTTLQDCTISNNTAAVCHAHGCGRGGGVWNGGNLTMTNCIVTGNHAGEAGVGNNLDGGGGGGIDNVASLTMSSCTISNNTAQLRGGGLDNYYNATAVVTNCTFAQNNCGRGAGAAIVNHTEHISTANTATLTVDGCTFSSNGDFNSGGSGGAVMNSADSGDTVSATFRNCTFDSNSGNIGGAFYNSASSTGSNSLTVHNCTFRANNAFNTACTIANYAPAVVHLGSSILKKGAFTPNLAGTIASDGYNLSNDNGSGALTGAFDQINTDPQFDPLGLQNNGGPTKTIALMTGSPALDKGNSFGSAADQRGSTRLIDDPTVSNGYDGTDVGAYESQDGGLQTGVPNYNVTTTDDTDDLSCGRFGCSLREAINRANVTSGTGTILFLVQGTITLNPALGPLTVTNSTSIGAVARSTIISGGGQTPVFRFTGGTNFLLGLTIRNGAVVTAPGIPASGAGLSNTGTSALNVVDCMFLNNQLIAGAGVSAGANGGAAQGAGVYNSATLTLNRCTIANNSATGGNGASNSGLNTGGAGGAAQGGGIYNNPGASLTMLNSTVANNSATGGAGGNDSGGFGGNGGGGEAGGVFSAGTVSMTGCTIASNTGSGGNGGSGNSIGNNGAAGTATGGVKRSAGNATIANTIVALNTGNFAPDVSGNFASQGYNFIGKIDNGSGFNSLGDQVGTSGSPINPNLGPLQDNGGKSDTMALLNPSPAIDAGKSFGLTVDQRYSPRPNDDPRIQNVNGSDGSDIGAFEFGAVLLVNTVDDHTDGSCDAFDCSLREAIDAANAQAGDQFIQFDPTLTASSAATIQLNSSLPQITGNTFIRGPGADKLTVKRGTNTGFCRIFNIGNGTASGPYVSIRGLTISTAGIGTPSDLQNGGGVLVDQSVLDLEYCTIFGNLASGSGGGVYIANRTNGEVSHISNCTFYGNTADGGSGGGLCALNAPVEIFSCTFSGNSAVNGGAIFVNQTNPSQFSVLHNCTLANNFASNHGRGLSKADGTIYMMDNIFSNAVENVQTFSTAPTSEGYNLANDNGGGYLNQPGDIINANAMLGPLAYNGGPTQTHALLAGSPAINAGQWAGIESAADQRGYPRDANFDIGAFEYGALALRITSIQRFSDGSIQLDGKGVINSSFTILASPDLVTGGFTSIGTATSNIAGDWHYTDLGSIGLTKRFLRASYP